MADTTFQHPVSLLDANRVIPAPNGSCYGRVLRSTDDGRTVYFAKLIDSSAQHECKDGPFASHEAAEARVIEYLNASQRFYGRA